MGQRLCKMPSQASLNTVDFFRATFGPAIDWQRTSVDLERRQGKQCCERTRSHGKHPKNEKSKGVDGFPRKSERPPRPLQALRIHHGKHQHFYYTSKQERRPCNPHQSFGQHRFRFSSHFSRFPGSCISGFNRCRSARCSMISGLHCGSHIC
jgi:hypothetical protein